MSVSTYIPDDTKIIHTAYADFVSRQISRPVHVVQYDDGLPVLEVKLFHDGQPYIVPSDADINIKLEKPDGKFVYNPALGCDSTRTIVYFEVTYQMAVLSGEISPVIEVLIGTSVSASSSISIIIDRNPAQKEAMESTSEWAAIQGAVKYAKEAIDAAADASASRSAAFISETNAKDKALEASEAALSAENSAVIAGQKVTEATTYATSAENSAGVSENYSKLSKSWACGDTGVRAGEDENNSEFYSKLAQQLTDEAQKLLDQAQKIVAASTSGALIPVGTVPFAGLPTNPAVGYMYNISDDFTTDDRFVEGAGIFYRAGANVYWTKDGQWDALTGVQITGVKGRTEDLYRTGNVNLTPANIGAVDKHGDIMDASLNMNGASSSILFTDFSQTGGNARGLAFRDPGGNTASGIGALSSGDGIPDELYFAVSNEPYNSSEGLRIDRENIKWKNTDLLTETGDTLNNIVTFTSGDSTIVNEWTDVSVLASKEKHSSILAKISTMFKNLRYLYKMFGTADISAIGDGTVTGAISGLNTNLGKQLKCGVLTDTISGIPARGTTTIELNTGLSSSNSIVATIPYLIHNSYIQIECKFTSVMNSKIAVRVNNNSDAATTSGYLNVAVLYI